MNTRQTKTNRLLAAASMVSNGSRLQFEVAIVLISIMPLLTLVYLFHGGAAAGNLSGAAMRVITFILAGMVCLGYCLLVKYPITIIHLRQYMESAARGELPSTVELPAGESDIAAIEKYFSLIVAQMKKRIATIQEQQIALLEAERRRVMAESFGAACHHLAQPATAIMGYLELLRRESLSSSGNGYLGLCIDAADKMRDTLGELQGVTEYRTEPYCVVTKGQEDASEKIIQLRSDPVVRLPKAREILQETFQVELAAVPC